MAPDTDRTDAPISLRATLGSWLEGPRAVLPELAATAPGERLGLPAQGPGSMVGFGGRVLAFALDSAMCAAIAWGLLGDPTWVTPIFALEVLLLTCLLGGSAGQLMLGMRVAGLKARVTPWRVLLRTVLLCLLIPAVMWDRDGRGLHDVAAGTVLLRT